MKHILLRIQSQWILYNGYKDEGDRTMKKSEIQLTRIVFGAVLAALVFVVTLFRFPLLGSKVHFANAVCLLSGLLLGPVWGGTAAGLGSHCMIFRFIMRGLSIC